MQGLTGTYGSRRLAILSVLFGISLRYDHRYCFPSQETILRLLERYHQVVICRRTLCYDLVKMTAEGLIDRLRRLTRKGILAGRFTSTLYFLKAKAFKVLNGLKKWCEKVSLGFRVQTFAHNKSQRENEILKQLSGNVEILLKSPQKGRASPDLILPTP